MDMALNELAVAVAAPTPVPAPIHAPTLATIPVALAGWSPGTIIELEAAGISEVSVDTRELMYMPAPAPVLVPVCTSAPTAVPAHVCFPAPALLVPMRAPPLTARDTAVDRYLAALRVAVLPRPARRSHDDMMFDFQVKNILCYLEDFNNGIPEDENDNAGAARRFHLRRRRN